MCIRYVRCLASHVWLHLLLGLYGHFCPKLTMIMGTPQWAYTFAQYLCLCDVGLCASLEYMYSVYSWSKTLEQYVCVLTKLFRPWLGKLCRKLTKEERRRLKLSSAKRKVDPIKDKMLLCVWLHFLDYIAQQAEEPNDRRAQLLVLRGSVRASVCVWVGGASSLWCVKNNCIWPRTSSVSICSVASGPSNRGSVSWWNIVKSHVLLSCISC